MTLTSLLSPRAILWDMDGVLVDTAQYHYDAWKTALADEGVQLGYEDFKRTFGQRNDTVLRDLISPDITHTEVDRIGNRKEDVYRQAVRECGIAPLPGVVHWLSHLSAQGWRHSVASAAPRDNVNCILDVTGIGHFFSALTSAEDVTRGKPDPQVYLLAAQRVGVLPARSIVIEDAPAGIEGARRSGMKCIGILSSHGHLDADIVVQSLEELDVSVCERLIGEQASSK